MPLSGSPQALGDDSLTLTVDGRSIDVSDPRASLLDALRDDARAIAAKDGCSPQGQCGCCTVLVDGVPRVACVTPVRRVAGRTITTAEGLDTELRDRLVQGFVAAGGSQCGFCTPGILCRLASVVAADRSPPARERIDRALLAHLCRCTGWQTIREAAIEACASTSDRDRGSGRDLAAASRRAAIEGRAPQRVGADVVLGRGGFAADTAPDGALVAVPDGPGWAVGETLAEARRTAGKVQGRRTTLEVEHPIIVPDGAWDATLSTTWVEPAYLEPDTTWCVPGGDPATPLANGGAFGAKGASELGRVARRLADELGRPVAVVLSREDVVRRGAKRPPLAGGMRRDGTGSIHVVRTPGVVEAIRSVAPEVDVTEVDVPGPPTSAALRAAGWAEAVALSAAARGSLAPVRSPDGGAATAEVADDGTISVRVTAGDPLDEIVLRSYAIGAAHMALSWVTSEAIAVDAAGVVHDLTIRSFGVIRAVDTPPISVEIDPTPGPPVNGSDAVFAAVAAAVWLARGAPPTWPTG